LKEYIPGYVGVKKKGLLLRTQKSSTEKGGRENKKGKVGRQNRNQKYVFLTTGSKSDRE